MKPLPEKESGVGAGPVVAAGVGSRPLVDLAARSLGGSVMAANDESFGEKENLVLDRPVAFVPGRFGHKGEVVDGWETRRRRPVAGFDWAVVRLGAPGVIREVDVETTAFTGNFPDRCRVEAVAAQGYPSAEELSGWRELVPVSALAGDAHNVFAVDSPRRYTHVRLSIYPDGGVGRLRVRGHVVPDPARFIGQTVDLAAAELGAVVESTSDAFYTSPSVLLMPGTARHMGEGWETRRQRGDDHDWLVVRLAARGVLRELEVDTTYYVCNASGEVGLWGADLGAAGGDAAPQGAHWVPVLPRIAVQPDTRHLFDVTGAGPFTHVRLDAFPDGGLSRLRVRGTAQPA